MLLCLASSLVTVVSEAGSEVDYILSFGDKKFYIRSPVSVFLFLMLYFMLNGLILFHKGDFHHVKCL